MNSARYTCVLALTAMALSAQTVPVDTVRTTAMVGIASGETARLNLLNPAPAANSTSTATAVPRAVTVTYFDRSGTPRKTAKVTVAPGTSQFVDLHSDSDLSLSAASRLEIRATVAIPNVPPPTASTSTASAPTPECTLVSTLEIFDNITLRTQVVVGKEVEVN